MFVSRASHDCNALREQNVAVPDSCVLFDSVSASSFAGNLEGSGSESALLSRCSSRRAEKPERSEGSAPESDVDDRSLEHNISTSERGTVR